MDLQIILQRGQWVSLLEETIKHFPRRDIMDIHEKIVSQIYGKTCIINYSYETQNIMELTVTLPKEQWEFVLEVLNLNNTNQIKNTAIALLKTQLDKQFEDANKEG